MPNDPMKEILESMSPALDADETARLLNALPERHDVEDEETLIRWATERRVGAIFLDLVLKGELTARIKADGTVAFDPTDKFRR